MEEEYEMFECPYCNGTGFDEETDEECPECDGTGDCDYE